MNRKETTASLAIVCMALLATIMTATTPKPALAIDFGSPATAFVEDGADSSGTSDNTDEDSIDEEQEDSTTAIEDEGSEDSDDSSNDQEDSSSLGYEAFQDCLAEIEESPTEERVQDCIKSSYGGQDESEDASSEIADGDDIDDTDVTQEPLANDSEEEEDVE
jgi:hypothetical protein